MITLFLFLLIALCSCYSNFLNSYSAIPQNTLDTLITTFAPELRFHKKEENYPSSVQWFTQRCALYKRENNKATIVLSRPIPDPNVLQKFPPKDYPHSFNQINDFYLSPDSSDKTRAGEPLVNNECKSPCYVHVQDTKNGNVVIQYIFFYPYQGYTVGLELLGKSLLNIGYHEGDWEHIDVHLRKTTEPGNQLGYTLYQVHYAAHGNKPHGKLLFAKDVPLSLETHPIAWVAKFGHANHEKDVNFDSATLDQTSNDGIKWKCWQCPIINIGDIDKPATGQEWIQFGGRWGATKEVTDKKITTKVANSPQGPGISSPWWRYAPTQYDKIMDINVSTKSGQASNYFDLKGKIPTRVRTLRWTINSPQAADIAFSVHEHRMLNKNRKNVYGPIQNNAVTNISQYNKGLYIADIKTKSGQSVTQPFTITIWAVEE
jgi:hypothetical protein